MFPPKTRQRERELVATWHALERLQSRKRAGGDVAQSLLVGDTLTDRRTAEAAGVPCILVGFGPSGDAVRDMAPAAVIAGYDALAEEVRRLIG